MARRLSADYTKYESYIEKIEKIDSVSDLGRDVALADIVTESSSVLQDATVNGEHDTEAEIDGVLEKGAVDDTDEHDADASPERTAKEQAVWETFREEHYEGVSCLSQLRTQQSSCNTRCISPGTTTLVTSPRVYPHQGTRRTS